MIATNSYTVVNGLEVFAYSYDDPHTSRPTVRQLDLLETAINACSYDWNRYRIFAGYAGGILVHWLPAEALYGGGIGIRHIDFSGAGSVYAPLTVPDGRYGDYGGVMIEHGFQRIYLLDTLDQDAGLYGGARFYMETVIRLLGICVAATLLSGAATQRARLARCFLPVDRDLDAPNSWDLAVPDAWYIESLGTTIDGPLPEPIATPWQTRLLEAVGETFKDVFTPKEIRRHSNRTAVRLKPGRAAWNTFVSLFMDEIPLSDFNFGLNPRFTYKTEWWDRPGHDIGPPPPGVYVWPDSVQVANGHVYSSRFWLAPHYTSLGSGVPAYDSPTVTVEVTPGNPSHLHATGYHWSPPTVQWFSGATHPTPGTFGSGSQRADVFPVRLVFPAEWFLPDDGIIVNLSGSVGEPPPDWMQYVAPNDPGVIHASRAGMQWDNVRVLMPTGAHPRFPIGELAIAGAENGVRRARANVGSTAIAEPFTPGTLPLGVSNSGARAFAHDGGSNGTLR